MALKNNFTLSAYRSIVKTYNLYYITSHLGIDPFKKEAQQDLKSQTKRALKTLGAVLNKENLSFKEMLRGVVNLVESVDFNEFNKEYLNYFKNPMLARATMLVRDSPWVGAETRLLI